MGGNAAMTIKNANIKPQTITGTPMGISIYAVTQEAPHYHQGFLEIIYCFKGTVNFLYNGKIVVLQEGDIASVDPFDIHYLLSEGTSKNDNLLVSFYFDLTSPVFEKPGLEKIYFTCEKETTPKEKQPQLQDLKRLLLTLLYFYCFPHPQLAQAETISRLSKQVIGTMLEHFHYFNYINYSAKYSDEMKLRFEQILMYIEENYSHKITLEKLCTDTYFNYKYISRFFKETSHVGFAKFVNNIRMWKSTVLLLDTDSNISDISYEVGFSAPMYYYKIFKLWTKMTPSQYRKSMRAAQKDSAENTCYSSSAIKEELEHYIAFYFAAIQMPQLWLAPFIPRKGVPEIYAEKNAEGKPFSAGAS